MHAEPALQQQALFRLLQLSSPMLPVGAYSYSQGLEWAVESGVVRDRDSSREWIADVLHLGISRFEAPLLCRLYRAWEVLDVAALEQANTLFLCSRESAELRAETEQMGYSLRRLLLEMGQFDAARLEVLQRLEPVGFPAVFSCAAVAWNIPLAAVLSGYLWSWLENQVMAAMKTIPLGQVAGQQIMAALADSLPALVEQAMNLPDGDMSTFSPALAIASARHETQYSRLFRS